jgi:biotin carboxylase
MNILLIASEGRLPYRVLRCAATAATVYVLGSRPARFLAFSRYCKHFYAATWPFGSNHDANLADEINALIEQLHIDIVLPGDATTTRSLISMRDNIVGRCFPMPTLETFDLLNDKWRFAQLCASLGIQCPATRLLADASALLREIELGSIVFPAIAKPISMSGGWGCTPLARDTAYECASTISYRPIVVQDFIPGVDVDTSVYCDSGIIMVSMKHTYANGRYTTFSHGLIRDCVLRIVERLKLNGVFNFDLRVTPDGRVYFIECNPRFFFTMHMSMLAGANFVTAGLGGTLSGAPLVQAQPRTIHSPSAAFAGLRSPGAALQKSWPALKFWLRDPLPILLERMGLSSDRLDPAADRGP